MSDERMRTALVLETGPRWDRKLFDDIREGDIFVVVEPDGTEHEVSVATTNAETKPPPEHGAVQCETTTLTKDQASMVYGPAERAGLEHDAIARGLLAMGRPK